MSRAPVGRGAALITTLGCALWVGSLDGDERLVAAPIAVLLVLGAWMIGVLRDRDGELPVFELGAITALVTLLYSVIPLAQFLAGGLQWGPLSSGKLQELQTDPATVAGLGWRHVTYLGSFVMTYLVVRGKRKIPRVDLKWPDSTSLWLAVSVYVGSVAFLFAVGSIYGVEFDPSYRNLVDTPEVRWAQMPYVLQQLFQTVGFIQQVAELALLLMLFKSWKRPSGRLLILALLGVELASVVISLGGRQGIALLGLGAILLYHRLVKPFGVSGIVVGFVAIVSLLLYGVARDALLTGGVQVLAENRSLIWTASNEFQALFGTAADVQSLKRAGTLQPFPWHYYLSDLYLLIPSQLLPFTKADASASYIALQGVDVKSAVMGVISLCVYGGDWTETVIRGMILGVVSALVHRWYVRRATGYWTTLLYVFLCVWSYYTFRWSTLTPLYFVVYRFVPFMLFVRGARAMSRTLASHRVAAISSRTVSSAVSLQE